MIIKEDKLREIARLRTLIVQEYQATQASARCLEEETRHAFVTKRMKLMWTYFVE